MLGAGLGGGDEGLLRKSSGMIAGACAIAEERTKDTHERRSAPSMFATATFVLAGLGLQIRGTTDCPRLEDVRARLAEIVPLSGEPRVEERAVIERRESSVRVALESTDGSIIGERELVAEVSCEELAQVVAVVLAAWLGDAHPELVARLPEPASTSSGERATPDAAARTSPLPPTARAKEVAPGAIRVEPPQASERIVPREPRRLVSTAALGASVGKFGSVPSGQVGLAWVSSHSGFGWALSAGISGERERALGDGLVRWSRWPLTTGPVLRVTSERVALELQAGPAVAWLRLAGTGFPATDSHQDVTYGGFAALRLGWRASALEPFISVSPQLWLRPATAFVSGSAPLQLVLPGAEVWFLAGLAVAPSPRKAR